MADNEVIDSSILVRQQEAFVAIEGYLKSDDFKMIDPSLGRPTNDELSGIYDKIQDHFTDTPVNHILSGDTRPVIKDFLEGLGVQFDPNANLRDYINLVDPSTIPPELKTFMAAQQEASLPNQSFAVADIDASEPFTAASTHLGAAVSASVLQV